MLDSIADDPRGFADELVRRSPVSASQFIASLSKTTDGGGEEGPAVVNIITTFPGPHGTDEEWDRYTVCEENARLHRENAELKERLVSAGLMRPDGEPVPAKAKPVEPKPFVLPPTPPAGPDEWTCSTCLKLVNIDRTYPTTNPICLACGQVYDARTGAQSQPQPGRGASGEVVGMIVGGVDADGWISAGDDLSTVDLTGQGGGEGN